MPVQPPTPAQRLAARDKPAGHPVMRQRWGDLLFLHWPVPPDLIQNRLPPGLHVDTFCGDAWLGVVPFSMNRVRPVGLPPLPKLSWFLELNVRTYVHDDSGNPGVWFFSLDCNQPLAVEVARRFFHLPYQHAAIQVNRSDDLLNYQCRRKSTDALNAEFTYGKPVNPRPAETGTLEWFLVERYRLFSANAHNELFQGMVHHAPYQISPIACDRFSAEPLRWEGFPEPKTTPPSVLVAEPVDVLIFPLRKCR
jgi:uncharacterized protein YqjF (DUF2071 family)